MIQRALQYVRGLSSVLVVALVVVAFGTITGFVWDRTHAVVAEEKIAPGAQAVPGQSQTQLLHVADWGVGATLPLVTELPLVSFAQQTSDVIGLSSADLMKLGAECQPSRSALGTLMRFPTGEYGKSVKPMVGANVVATAGTYDFIYQFPQTACANNPTARNLINLQTSIVLEALGTLTLKP